MYYPYFRGKQYELVAIRESTPLMRDAGFTPIIEPVREQKSGLLKTLDYLESEGARSILIINPQIGDHSGDGEEISAFLKENCESHGHITVGVLLTEGMKASDALAICNRQDASRRLALIHAGFSDASGLAPYVRDNATRIDANIFLEAYCGKLYQRHFKGTATPILVRDGCTPRQRNRDHPDTPEFFSDLHITYPDEGVDGFGDFLVVGGAYSEAGGPAYTVAIHLTFIDGDNDDAMYIWHFKSDRQDTPKDPAGKFQEAVAKLVDQLRDPNSKFCKTRASLEFCDLHDRGHYPGLGYVKKLAMMHHIETLANYAETHGGR
ncbi:sce7725 family protein [Botrimarina mediterranea]|uniref:Uncharacterized protein n=1 Tax=Botrimarina mediterranea TaxID=2528022 RepID=A0A518K288_9BACT|nr:sce7725 family protein [Botrimarina mediterranea]QDV71887.1 hypothetical protein Spa11_00560 [Botrimarina mediterranea]